MTEFFAMGGYAGFVWSAYGASAIVLATAAVLTFKAHARAKRAMTRLEEEANESGGEKR